MLNVPTEREGKSSEDVLHFPYDKYCDLLGGAKWDQLFDPMLPSDSLIPDQAIQRDIASRYLSPDQFLYSDDISGLYPLEILWLKWNLFTELCKGILRFHTDKRQPHLYFHPANTMITIPAYITDTLPVRWIFGLRIPDSEISIPFRDPDIPAQYLPRLFSPPKDSQSLYAAPIIRKRPPGHEEDVTVLIRSKEKVRKHQGSEIRAILQVHLISENIRPSEYSEMDVFNVILRFNDENIPPVNIWGSKIESPERGLPIKGNTDPITTAVWEALEKESQSVFYKSKVKIYQSLHVPCDLYTLGMMLFRTFLVNDNQDFFMAEQVIHRIAGSLEPMVQGLEPDRDKDILIRRLRTRLIEERVFPKETVLFRGEDRGGAEGCSFIPDDIWYEIILTGLRLITWIPGFSFCRSHGDFDIENPQYSMDKVMRPVQDLRRRIRIELFGSRQRNREVLEVCDMVRKELTAGMEI